MLEQNIKDAYKRFCKDPNNKDRQDILFSQLENLFNDLEEKWGSKPIAVEEKSAEFAFTLIDCLGVDLVLKKSKRKKINEILEALQGILTKAMAPNRENGFTIDESLAPKVFCIVELNGLLNRAEQLEPLITQYANFKSHCNDLASYLSITPEAIEAIQIEQSVEAVEVSSDEFVELPLSSVGSDNDEDALCEAEAITETDTVAEEDVSLQDKSTIATDYLAHARADIKAYMIDFYMNYKNPEQQEHLTQLSVAKKTSFTNTAETVQNTLKQQRHSRATQIIGKVLLAAASICTVGIALLGKMIYSKVTTGYVSAIRDYTRSEGKAMRVRDAVSDLLDESTREKVLKKAAKAAPAG